MLTTFLWIVAMFNLILFSIYHARGLLNSVIKIGLLLIGVFSILFATGVL